MFETKVTCFQMILTTYEVLELVTFRFNQSIIHQISSTVPHRTMM